MTEPKIINQEGVGIGQAAGPSAPMTSSTEGSASQPVGSGGAADKPQAPEPGLPLDPGIGNLAGLPKPAPSGMPPATPPGQVSLGGGRAAGPGGPGQPKEPEIKERKPSWFITHANYVAGGLALLILALGWMMFIRPASQQANEFTETDIQQLEAELRRKQTELFRVTRIAQALEALPAATQERLVSALPRQAGEPDLIVNIAALGAASDLDLTSVELIPVVKQEGRQVELDSTAIQGVETLTINANYKGISYTSLKAYLRNVESNLRLMRVKTFDFDPRISEIRFELESYFME